MTKKIFIILTAILALLYVILSLVCADKEYAAEKLIYRAGKTMNKISVNPDVAPPAMAKSVEKHLETVLNKYSGTTAAKVSKMILAEFYVSIKQYDKGISALNDIIKTEKDNPAAVSRAHFIKGNAYEKQNKWAQALQEYVTLKEKYYNTPLGMQMPIYIGDYYKSRGDDAAAQKAYSDAVLFYRKIESENSKKPVGYVAENFLLQSYVNLKQYEEAVRVIEDIINNYPSTQTFAQQIRSVEFIVVKTLKDNKKAIAIYNGMKEKSKDPQLIRFVDERVEALNK